MVVALSAQAHGAEKDALILKHSTAAATPGGHVATSEDYRGSRENYDDGSPDRSRRGSLLAGPPDTPLGQEAQAAMTPGACCHTTFYRWLLRVAWFLVVVVPRDILPLAAAAVAIGRLAEYRVLPLSKRTIPLAAARVEGRRRLT